jgi:ABC-type Fe3+/spermidine/putrescine transport system ATPase subunit
MVFQDGALFPHLSVIDNVRYGMARSERRGGRARELLDLVGLADKGERPPGTLSGGEQQRVAVARALARRPAVLLLDEPFSSLDTALRVQLRGEVHRLLKEVGVTTVLVTHDQHEALMFGDRVAVMRSGRLEQVDTPAGLYRRPASAWVAGFVGEANLLAGAAREGAAGVGGTASEGSAGNGAATDGSGGNGAAGAGSGTAGAGADRSVCTAIGAITTVRRHQGSVVVLCRPEELVMRAGGDARLLDVAYFGQESRYEVRLASGESVVVRASGVPAHDPGDQVTVRYTGGEAAAWPSSLP